MAVSGGVGAERVARSRSRFSLGARLGRGVLLVAVVGSSPARGGVLLCLPLSILSGPFGLGAGVFLVLPHPHMYLQFSALDALAGMMMKGAAKCDKHAE